MVLVENGVNLYLLKRQAEVNPELLCWIGGFSGVRLPVKLSGYPFLKNHSTRALLLRRGIVL